MVKTKKHQKGAKTFKRWFLKDWRTNARLTVEQLAQAAGYTGASISRLENGLQGYTQEALEAFAPILHCTPSDLIGRPPGEADNPGFVAAQNILDALRGKDEASQRRIAAVVEAIKDIA
jgi:transcriptional regulator with XRE-family HTH domain